MLYFDLMNFASFFFQCGGKSMEPVVHPGDVWVTECISRTRGTVHK